MGAALVYENTEYDIGLYTEGLSGYWKCEKCGEILGSCGIDFVANNREKTRYELPKEFSEEHECKKEE